MTIVLVWLTGFYFFGKLIGIYIAALTLVRLMGKRALGELGLFDLVVMAGIGDVIVVVGLEQKVPFDRGLIILGMIGVLELVWSVIAYHSRFFAKLIEGEPTLLVKDGVPIKKNLAKEHISPTDLQQELRKQGISRLSQVAHAFLEACGKVSVIRKSDSLEITNYQLWQELTEIRQELKLVKDLLQLEKEK